MWPNVILIPLEKNYFIQILYKFPMMHLKVVKASCWWVKLDTWKTWLPLVAVSCNAVSTKYTNSFCRMDQQDQVLECVCVGSSFLVLGGEVVAGSWSPVLALHSPHFLFDPIMTFETKLTMALAGCSGSCSANRWHMFSVSLWDFLATNPKILEDTGRDGQE